ncbi:MAG: DUF945 family protein, partial [Myxococcota bacterium]
MKKLVVSLLLFGLAGLGGFSLWAGMTAQREYRDAIHAFGEQPDVRVLESSFERGWIRSHAESQIELHGQPGEAFKFALEALGAEDTRARIGFRMTHDIEHGPRPLWDWLATGFRGAAVLAEVSSVFEFDHESRAEFATVVGKIPSIAANTVVRSGGAAETQFTAPSQILETVTDAGTRTVVWKGMRGSLLVAPGGGSFVGNLRAPGFEAEGPSNLVSATGLEWHLDVGEGDGLPVGESVWRLGSLRIESSADVEDIGEPSEELAAAEPGDESVAEPLEPDRPKVAADPDEAFAVLLQGLTVGQSSRVGAGRYAGDFWAEVQRIELGPAVYGPGELRFALTDVDADALRKLRRTSQRIEAQAASGEISAETASAAVAGEMMELVPELLAQSPRLALESLALGLPAGNLRGSGAVWFAGEGSAPAHLFDVLAGLGGELDIEAPALSVDTFLASLAPQVEAADSEGGLGDLRKRGLIILDGAVYRTRARWRNGQATINGLPYETVFPADPENGDVSEPDADEAPAAEPSMAPLFDLLAARQSQRNRTR